MLLVTILVSLLIVMIAFFAVVKSNVLAQKRELEKAKEDYTGFGGHYNDSYETGQFILKIKPWIFLGYAVLVIVIGLFTAVYSTTEKEIGFTSVFGHNELISTAGIHFKTPFVSSTHIFDATTQGMAIGYTEETDESVTEDSLMITSDFNFINIDFYLEYRIVDPIQYYYCTDNPEGILENIAQSAIRNTVGRYSVDEVMTTGKGQIEIDVLNDIDTELAKCETGLDVLNVTIQDSEPPTEEVAKAFKDVEDAKQNADTAVNEANAYTNTQIPAAEAKAKKIEQDAEASKTVRINEAKEEVASFEALFSEYSLNPESVKNRMYLEALSEVLPNMEIVISKDGKVIYVDSNSEVTQKSEESK